MSNKIQKIIALAQEKAETKRIAVLSTIDLMKKEGQIINFTSVSRNAQVSRNYLYKNKELRSLIESLREVRIYNENKDNEEIVEKYNNLLDKYNQLLEENKDLKKQLKGQ